MSVVIETTVGDITVDLFMEQRPVACLNFMKLCKLKYYNFNLFHTVEQGFIAQAGDPTGVGNGGSSVWGVVEGPVKRFFEAESLPKIRHKSPGLLSLVSVGKHLVGSQFLLTLGSDLTSLDGIHCVIGEVVEGQEVLRRLNETIVDEKFRPFQDIRITHTVILDDPFPDPRGFRVPSRSPSPSVERLQNGRIGADEDVDDTGGKTMEEIQEMLAEREAKARATILEIVGDLPDADMAPPENVLFVCKLNPVTTDDDLEIIFSRFGKVKNCEVIRDKKSGDSLQYAFVEFEEQKSCEAAYFKMDNVLIDDRRIHVDFSQSVAKVKWHGKGRGVDGPEGRLDFNNLRDNVGTKVIQKSRRKQDEVNEGNERGRARMTSEERKKAREKRHLELERDTRSRRQVKSRSRSIGREYKSRRRDDIRQKSGGSNNRENSRERTRDYRGNIFRRRSGERHEERHRTEGNECENLLDKRRNRGRNWRSRSREHDNRKMPEKRYSPERRRNERYSPNQRHREASPGESSRNFSIERRAVHQINQEQCHKNSRKKEKVKHIKKCKAKNKTKKTRNQSTSSERDSSSDTTNSSDSESTSNNKSSDSTDSRPSQDERKKKKNNKLKKNKNRSKKSKKHIR